MKTLFLVLFCIVLLLSATRVWCETYDNDTKLEFYWKPASGSLKEYRIYLSIDGGDYQYSGEADATSPPTLEKPYVVPQPAENGKQYQLKVEAVGVSGGTIMSEPSDMVLCDLSLPETTASLSSTEGENGWYTSSVTVTLKAIDSVSGIKETRYRIGNGSWQVYSAPFIAGNSTVYYCSEDKARNVEAEDSIRLKVDTSLPETPIVAYDNDSGDQSRVSWKSSDAESGISEYQYAVGTIAGGIDVTGWTSAGTRAELNLADLYLPPGKVYYIAVRARNEAGVLSSVGFSDGITYSDVPGDVNDDGNVDCDDVILALKIAVQLLIPTDRQKWAADMNGDGKVKSDDALLILALCEDTDGAAPDKFTMSSGDNMSVVLPEAHGVAGENIKVPIRIHETYRDPFRMVRGGDICIAYDGAVLQALSVSSTPDVLMASNNAEPGILRIAFAYAGGINGSMVFDAQFTILTDEVSPLVFENLEFYDSGGHPIRSSGMDGRFSSWAIPPEYSALLQNFPNPFNPETWIPYQLREDSDVTIRIYSLSGSLVRRLSLGYKQAGLYVSRGRAAYWDGRNEEGESVASGVYFVAMEAGEYQGVRRICLLR